MLRAHANMPIEDFIAQLRTYVIAMGLSPQVIDCVDKLADIDKIEDAHAEEIREVMNDANDTARKTRDEILEAVEKWLDKYSDFSESQRNSLLNAIRDV